MILPIQRIGFKLTMNFVLLMIIFSTANGIMNTAFHKPPQIVKKLEKQVQLKFGPLNRFVLECVADAQPQPNYTWFKNNSPLESNTAGITEITDADHSQLEFTSPGPEHVGYYHCVAENDLGRAKSTVVHVAENFPPPPRGTVAPAFTKAPENEIPSVGSSVEFYCEAEGVPEPTIVWTKNGEVMPHQTTGVLALRNIGPSDVANYACNASNVAGYEYKDVYLNVLTVAASISEGPRDRIVSKGSNITLACSTQGFPAPTITWRMNGTILEQLERYKINKDTGSLWIREVGLDDQGEYECEAENHGRDTASAFLAVRSRTEIIEGPSDQEAAVFTTLEMPCTVVSDLSEKLTVLWKKDNIDLGQVGFAEAERISQDENYSLVIKNLTFDDSGTYTCVASTATNLVTDSGQLTVVGIAPAIKPVEPIPPVLEGASLTLTCELTAGYQPPTITWFKDGVELNPELVEIVDPYTVMISNARQVHSGDYTCRAANKWGHANQEVNVKVRKKTQIVSQPDFIEFSKGQTVVINCDVDVDTSLMGTLEVDWYKGDNKLEVIQWLEDFPMGERPEEAARELIETESLVSEIGLDPLADGSQSRMFLMPNSSLRITGLQQDDLGYYRCVVRTELEAAGLHSEPSQIYIPAEFPWWIILLVVVIMVLLICVLCCIWRVRKRTRGKGYYGVKDVEKSGVKHNQSDIYYTTEDVDSVMNEQDNVPIKISTPQTTYTPKVIRQLSNLDKSNGSVGSLLEDDEFLKKGMDEDGSFRERYTD